MSKSTRAAIAALVVLHAGCFSPPIVRPGGRDKIDVGLFPIGTQRLDLPVGDSGESLRGVWIPGDTPDAPAVVQFLPTGTGISSGWRGLPQNQILWDLRDRGLASLIVDYRGVGASDGDVHGGQLRSDAATAWNEALRRVGDADRIVLRGNSLGTLAVATLLQDGVRPAAVVLAAPILDDTVTYNVMSERFGVVLAWLIDALIFHDPVGVDLIEELSKSQAPRLILVGGDDEYLGKGAQERLTSTVRAAGGHVVVEPEWSHLDLGAEGYFLLPGESDLYARLFPDAVNIEGRLPENRSPKTKTKTVAHRWRLDPPHAGVPFARLADRYREEDLARVVDWYRKLPATTPTDADSLSLLLDFDDPAGPLDLSELATLGPYAFVRWKRGAVITIEELPSLAVQNRFHRRKLLSNPDARGFDRVLPVMESIDLDNRKSRSSPKLPPRLRLAPRESLRQVVRVLLKSRGVPERVTTSRDGVRGIEWRDASGRWQALTLPALAGPMSAQDRRSR
jgi:Serine aminopeptidase, S33